MKDIDEEGINIFRIPECDSDEDEEFKKKGKELKVIIVFFIFISLFSTLI